MIGGTVYPGLTLTAGSLWKILNSLNIPLFVETVCVFTAPIFSSFSSWAAYLLTKEVKGVGAGLTTALLKGLMNHQFTFHCRIMHLYIQFKGMPHPRLVKITQYPRIDFSHDRHLELDSSFALLGTPLEIPCILLGFHLYFV